MGDGTVPITAVSGNSRGQGFLPDVDLWLSLPEERAARMIEQRLKEPGYFDSFVRQAVKLDVNKLAPLFILLTRSSKGSEAAGAIFNRSPSPDRLADLFWQIDDPAVVAIVHLQGQFLARLEPDQRTKFTEVTELMAQKYARSPAGFEKANRLLFDEEILTKDLFRVSSQQKLSPAEEVKTKVALLGRMIGKRKLSVRDREYFDRHPNCRGYLIFGDDYFAENSVIIIGGATGQTGPEEAVSTYYSRIEFAAQRLLLDFSRLFGQLTFEASYNPYYFYNLYERQIKEMRLLIDEFTGEYPSASIEWRIDGLDAGKTVDLGAAIEGIKTTLVIADQENSDMEMSGYIEILMSGRRPKANRPGPRIYTVEP